MQMMMGAWTAQTISAVTETHGVDAKPDFLERALRVCASVGVFTEAADGRFGPTPLSEVLTPESPASVNAFVELIGGRWWKLIGALPEALQTGQSQAQALTGREPWTAGEADREEQFGRAMRSRVESTRGATPPTRTPACWSSAVATTCLLTAGSFAPTRFCRRWATPARPARSCWTC